MNNRGIIPGVYVAIRFLADGINGVPVNDVIKGMEVAGDRYKIAQGRLEGKTLQDLLSQHTAANTDNLNVSIAKNAQPSRLYDELGL